MSTGLLHCCGLGIVSIFTDESQNIPNLIRNTINKAIIWEVWNADKCSSILELVIPMPKICDVFQPLAIFAILIFRKLIDRFSFRRKTPSLAQDLECIICLTLPNTSKDNVKAFSCQQHHILCSGCLKLEVAKCPVCNEDFKVTRPQRNFLAERLIRQHLESQKLSPGSVSAAAAEGKWNKMIEWLDYGILERSHLRLIFTNTFDFPIQCSEKYIYFAIKCRIPDMN